MIQIKTFEEKISRRDIEEKVNTFLRENADKIEYVDLKYTTGYPFAGSARSCWTAVLIYRER